MRKTKIICTLGPSTDDINVLRDLVQNGMNVARLNFSHGSHADQKKRIDAVKKVREELGVAVGIMLDTKGPEVRIKTFEEGKVTLHEGSTFTLKAKDVLGNDKEVSLAYTQLYKDVGVGCSILLDDGLIELKVIKIEDKDIVCEVINGGVLSNSKSVNIPGISLKMPYMSETDEADILFGIENDIDFIAASFVRSVCDVIEVRRFLEKNNGKNIHIIAKIENREGVDHIDDILKASDGIMVARGDMGVEIPFEELPLIQKELIKKCYKASKKAITATQMLESMIRNPRPTRAETTDIANAIYDGTSAIMLSGETAVGKYPLLCVKTMDKIARSAEDAIDYREQFYQQTVDFEKNVTNAICHATCMTAHDLGATAIITVTRSGHTARMVSSFRPECPIIATTPIERVYRQLSMSWGIIPVLSTEKDNTDDLFDHAVDKALETGIVANGDLVVITGGIPVGISGTTNILKVHLVGHVLSEGVGINTMSATGRLCVAKTPEQAIAEFNDGEILVVPYTNNDLLPILKRASGIIVEAEGTTSHAAIVGLTLDIPVITSAKGATKVLKSGTVVSIDSARGLVYSIDGSHFSEVPVSCERKDS